jgi:hypothetical protein
VTAKQETSQTLTAAEKKELAAAAVKVEKNDCKSSKSSPWHQNIS